MRVILFNLIHSDNLGDEIIAKCLENALSSFDGIAVESIDISGRSKRGGVSGRATLLRVLQRLPFPIRRLVMRTLLYISLRCNQKKWTEKLRGCDLAVFGGGHLFQDNDMNFPLKIAAAARAAHAADVPVAVFAVGVSRDWSKAAARSFQTLLMCDIVFIGVRDRISREHWERHFTGFRMPPVQICRDPGLLAIGREQSGTRGTTSQVVGIGITHPSLLSYHANVPVVGLVNSSLFFTKIAILLLQEGFDVCFFTNGAVEDEVFKGHLKNRIKGLDIPFNRIQFASGPKTGEDLISTIQEFKSVIAHRLHTAIVAFALNKPHVGLAWDEKLDAFFASVGRERFLITDHLANPETVVAKLLDSMNTRFDLVNKQAVTEAALAVSILVRTVQNKKKVCNINPS